MAKRYYWKKLYYWIAEVKDDSQVYSLIGKTKKDVIAQMERNGVNCYEKLERRVLVYRDAPVREEAGIAVTRYSPTDES